MYREHYSAPSNQIRTELSQKERRDIDGFSFTRYALAQMGHCKLDGIEKEMTDEGKRESSYASGGVGIMPENTLSFKALAAGSFRNDLTVGGSGTGAEVIAREPLAPLIDTLFEAMQLRNAGAQVFTNIKGNLPMPKLARSTARPVEKTETAAATELSPEADEVILRPHRIPAYILVSMQFLKQSKVAEPMLRQYLAQELAARWEAQAINGGGTGADILGLLNTPGIGSVAGGANGLAPTWAHIVELEKDVSTFNDIGRRYLTNSAVRQALKKTLKAGSDSEFIWKDRLENSLNGYSALVSDLVPSNLTKGSASGVCSAIISGDFRDFALAQWGGMELLVDRFTYDTIGKVKLSTALYCDSAVLKETSFSAMQDALTA